MFVLVPPRLSNGAPPNCSGEAAFQSGYRHSYPLSSVQAGMRPTPLNLLLVLSNRRFIPWVIIFFNGMLPKNVDIQACSCEILYTKGVLHCDFPRTPSVNTCKRTTSAARPNPSSAGTTIALLFANLRDWLPGVAGPEPRLGAGFLGGQFEKGGLHQPPFYFCIARRWLPFAEVRRPRVVRKVFPAVSGLA